MLTFDDAMRCLERRGYDARLLYFAPVHTDPDTGRLGFYGERDLSSIAPDGQKRTMIRRVLIPITASTIDRNRFVGFLYPDGSLRDDSEIVNEIRVGGGVHTKIAQWLVFWRRGIEPTKVAENLERLRQRPMIVRA